MIFRERLKWPWDIGSSSDTSSCAVKNRFLVNWDDNNRLEIDFSTFNIIFTLRIVNFQWPSRDISIFTSVSCALLYFFRIRNCFIFQAKEVLTYG